ncbi:CLUMA_CG005691, isoform A [Clunio marinus]|uniref:CLUMA_CG005691, isoform A n=1 Tax=Clunio marinus TaxID=568069 RepID=A0A1J1HVR8_9DIPT|nr:CLUMA_CG005691, isoform A [Clunio marinus]
MLISLKTMFKPTPRDILSHKLSSRYFAILKIKSNHHGMFHLSFHLSIHKMISPSTEFVS